MPTAPTLLIGELAHRDSAVGLDEAEIRGFGIRKDMSIMESMGRKRPCPGRSFTSKYKAEFVELRLRGDRSVGQVATDFDLTETAVRDWERRAEVDAGERDGLSSSECERG
ncbi:hypothetical protein [Streptomyces sp. bgisy154]|uniref:hypothetical protein n=1 Tax=Streptomyces sp. bgisy154 TaxID=3413794 RepID=UPI003D719DE9